MQSDRRRLPVLPRPGLGAGGSGSLCDELPSVNSLTRSVKRLAGMYQERESSALYVLMEKITEFLGELDKG